MIFLDANIILRVLAQSTDSEGQKRAEIGRSLLRQADRGEIDITTSDAILAEVAFVLTSRKHYQLPAENAAALISSIVRLRGFRHREKATILRSLDIWAQRPQLGFVDALTAAYALEPGIQLATFDTDFDDLSHISRWTPNGQI